MLWLNLCSFRWLNPNQSLVINLSPSGLKMTNIELGMGQIIFITLAVKILTLDVWILKLSLFHSFIVHGKKEYLNASILQEYFVIFLVFWVLYKADVLYTFSLEVPSAALCWSDSIFFYTNSHFLVDQKWWHHSQGEVKWRIYKLISRNL